ncbi:MAG: hypothetical protein KGH61_04155 [Candidatus Micrarchaeota archaeon]|nr:hypothetical protein [Candidatus Micrarchaeota archaeon]MDE1848113.1 hypothetical protein [Candidatus Micrarchaeota archaeon]MDE1863920.1 hypothetical protein [Candidatus Micrarchaeota archaeon]
MNNRYALLISFLILSLIPTFQAQTGQGFIITGVSLSNILHPGQSSSQTQWIVTASLNGGGQSLVGTLTNQTINYQGYTSVYPLQISANTSQENAFYLVNNNQPQQIYKFSSLMENGTASNFLGAFQGATLAPICPTTSNGWTNYGEEDFDMYSSGITGTRQTYTVARICLYYHLIGIEASISSSPNTQFSSHFLLSANGQQELLNVSNIGSQSATSTDGKVQINWVGSLVTGNAAPDGSQYVAINDQNSSIWGIQTQNTYQSYKTAEQTALNLNGQNYQASTSGGSILPSSCSSLSVVFSTEYILETANCLNTLVQNQFTSVNQEASGLWSGGSSIGGLAAEYKNYQNQPAFLVTLPSYFTTTNPLITLRITGSFIGVVIPEGTPKILSVTSSPFNSGGNGTIKIEVENIGNAEGSFNPSLSNSCQDISTQSQPNYAVSSGQTQEIDIPIYSTGTNENISEQCNVTVADINGGGSSSAEVVISMKPANECTQGQEVVQGSLICSCVSLNEVYVVGTGNECQSCQYGVVYKNGAPICATNPLPTNEIENETQLNSSINNAQTAKIIVNDVVVPVATNFVIPAVCSSTGPIAGLCSEGLDYLASLI